jgi:multidrug resistance efflux pump
MLTETRVANMTLQKVRKKYIHNFFYVVIMLTIVIGMWFRVIRVNESIGFPGVIKSRNIEVIKSPCDTYLKEIRVIPGEEVHKGQLLARLDGVGIQYYIQDLNAKIVEADKRKTDLAATIDITSYQISVMEQNIIQCRVKFENAAGIYQENEKLFKNGAISRLEFQQSKNEMITLQAELTKQENNLNIFKRRNNQEYHASAAGEINFLNDQINEYQKILNTINRQFLFTNDYAGSPCIIAPCDGIITAIGDSALDQTDSSGKTFKANETIFEISDPNDIYIEGSIREKDFPYVGAEDKVYITFIAYPYQKYGVFEGTIDKLYQKPTLNLSQTQYKCEIKLFNIKSNRKVKMYSGLNTYNTVDTQKNYNLFEYIGKKMFENTTR